MAYDNTWYEPPRKVVDFWCDKCGLKQWSKPRKKHTVHGEHCTGTVQKVTYTMTHQQIVIDAGTPRFK